MERLMQYVWQHRLWHPSDMATVDGERLEVIDPGLLNYDAGPDFFNAKLRIGDKIWAGNVEIHVNASDWYRHGHDSDPAYDSVVLHVVGKNDMRIERPNGLPIPQIVMDCADNFAAAYDEMVNGTCCEPACLQELSELPDIYKTDWLSSLAFDRIYSKAAHLGEIIARCDGNWRAGVYVLLARALGFSTNSDAFERLAIATPLARLLHHQGDGTAIEAALFGQAGLLGETLSDCPEKDYLDSLRAEYAFMKAKYGLEQPAGLGWKMARMRPQNFPHRRIAFLAKAVADGFQIASQIAAVDGIDSARRLFDIKLGKFWASHYTFAPTGMKLVPGMGASSVNSLIINVVVPALYHYSTTFGGRDTLQQCVELLQALPPEDNRITRIFDAAGISCPDALTSQALIHLRRNYCEPRKCLYCRFGHRFLSAKAIRRK